MKRLYLPSCVHKEETKADAGSRQSVSKGEENISKGDRRRRGTGEEEIRLPKD